MEGAYRGTPRGRGGKFEWNGIWLSAGNAKQRGHTGERKRRELDWPLSLSERQRGRCRRSLHSNRAVSWQKGKRKTGLGPITREGGR